MPVQIRLIVIVHAGIAVWLLRHPKRLLLIAFLVLLAISSSTAYCYEDPDLVSFPAFRMIPLFGVEVVDVTEEMASAADLDKVKGCFVQLVLRGSPAEEAGVEAGDIIVSLNNRGIRNAKELQNDVSGLEPGREAKICVVRDDYRTTLSIVPSDRFSRISTVEAIPYLGVRLSDLDESSAEMLGLEEAGKEGGVLCTYVFPSSPADKAGIQPGDIIMSFNSRKVRTTAEFITDLSGAQVGQRVRICIMRGEIRKTLYPVLTDQPDSFFLKTAYESAGREKPSVTLSEQQLIEVLPSAERFFYQKQPVPHYNAYDKADHFVGLAYVTSDICPDAAQGYHGEIATLVGLDAKGTIVGVKVLSYTESLNIIQTRQLDNFVKQYVNKHASESLVLGKDIDAISGATITSSAINYSIAQARSVIVTTVLDMETPPTDQSLEPISWSRLLWEIDTLLFLGIALVAVLGYLRHSQMTRFFVFGASLGYLGYVKGGGLSINDVVNILQTDFPLIDNTLYWYSLVCVVAITTIFFGRFYCGWLCPFGALTEMLYRAFPIKKISVPIQMDAWLRLIKYILLLSILFVVFIVAYPYMGKTFIENVEPFGTIFRFYGTLLMWFFLFIILAGSVFVSRVYCRYLCPLGAFFALVTMVESFVSQNVFRIDPKKRRRKKGAPVGVCPMGAMLYEKQFIKMSIKNGECIECTH